MAQINPCFNQLKREYIFPVIETKLADLKRRFPESNVINLGIGDVALPLAPAIVEAICLATQEMGTEQGIKGYAPSNGYLFLREIIAEHAFAQLKIDADEIFISDVFIRELLENAANELCGRYRDCDRLDAYFEKPAAHCGTDERRRF